MYMLNILDRKKLEEIIKKVEKEDARSLLKKCLDISLNNYSGGEAIAEINAATGKTICYQDSGNTTIGGDPYIILFSLSNGDSLPDYLKYVENFEDFFYHVGIDGLYNKFVERTTSEEDEEDIAKEICVENGLNYDELKEVYMDDIRDDWTYWVDQIFEWGYIERQLDDLYE